VAAGSVRVLAVGESWIVASMVRLRARPAFPDLSSCPVGQSVKSGNGHARATLQLRGVHWPELLASPGSASSLSEIRAIYLFSGADGYGWRVS
jgi:hypothetical protein